MDISADEVKQYYAAHPQEFTLPERVVLSEISLSTEGKSPEELAAVRNKAEGLRSSVLNGDNFNQVASLYSEGSTAKNGGGLGTFKKGELAPQLEAIVFQMSKGEISEVIQTRTGFEILKVEDHLQAGLQPLEKVEPDIRNILHAQKMQPLIRDYLAELREQSYIILKPGYTTAPCSPAPTFRRRTSLICKRKIRNSIHAGIRIYAVAAFAFAAASTV